MAKKIKKEAVVIENTEVIENNNKTKKQTIDNAVFEANEEANKIVKEIVKEENTKNEKILIKNNIYYKINKYENEQENEIEFYRNEEIIYSEYTTKEDIDNFVDKLEKDKTSKKIEKDGYKIKYKEILMYY